MAHENGSEQFSGDDTEGAEAGDLKGQSREHKPY